MMASGAGLQVGGQPVEVYVDDLVRQLLQQFDALHPVVVSFLMLLVGLAFLLYGVRIYKWVVILVYACVGVFVGDVVAERLGINPYLGMIVGAILFGLVAWPLYVVAWGLLGGVIFGLLVAVLVMTWTTVAAYVFIAGAIAFIGGLVLALLLLRPAIIIQTAIFGAELVVLAMLGFVKLAPSVGDPVLRLVHEKPYVLVIIAAVLAVLGVVLQWSEGGATGKKTASKKPKKAEESGGE